MPALITGATGFVGSHLLRRLPDARVVSRDPARGFAWDRLDEALRGVDVVYHLAGESVGTGRWTREKKEQILASRVDSTRRLVEAIRGSPPRAFVCASAVGIYGDRGDEILDERSAPGEGFLADVCKAWEAEAAKAPTRVVHARFGLVLGPDGGLFPKIVKPFRWCVGGRLGNGRQWMPWVHIDDVVEWLLRAPELEGPVNVVAPNPVTNREFTKTLARVLGRPAILPVPRFALRIAKGEFARDILSSQRVRAPAGHAFRHPELEPALRAITSS